MPKGKFHELAQMAAPYGLAVDSYIVPLGAGAGALLTAITAAALAVPWDRFPLLASSGVMLSFLGKILVMIGVVLLAGPHKSAMSPAWFLGTLAAVLLGVAAVEIASLAAARSPTVESGADGE